MAIDKISSVLGTSLPELGSREKLSSTGGAGKSSFESLVMDGLKDVNKELVDSSKMSEEFLTEGKHDMHEVMIALERADLSFKYVSQIRNRVLDAYSEVMRMQV